MSEQPPGRAAAITSWGTALPPNVVTNDDLAQRLDTSDEWIRDRTGIRERRIGGVTSELAAEAAKNTLDRAGLSPADLDLIILATSTPDDLIPSTATKVAGLLGAQCGTFDLNAACTGFVYGLVTANGLVRSGFDRVLLIGAETMSKVVDQDDRSIAVLFGDGAGALLLEATPGEDRLLGVEAGTDPDGRNLLLQQTGGLMSMEGKEVFRRAVRVTVESAITALERAKVEPKDVTLFVPHQANIRIIEAACQRIEVPIERTAIVVDKTGNTSTASIPLALAEALDQNRLHDGDVVLFSGFGAGMTWASAVWRWGS